MSSQKMGVDGFAVLSKRLVTLRTSKSPSLFELSSCMRDEEDSCSQSSFLQRIL